MTRILIEEEEYLRLKRVEAELKRLESELLKEDQILEQLSRDGAARTCVFRTLDGLHGVGEVSYRQRYVKRPCRPVNEHFDHDAPASQAVINVRTYEYVGYFGRKAAFLYQELP